jgi:hypothetical protein
MIPENVARRLARRSYREGRCPTKENECRRKIAPPQKVRPHPSPFNASLIQQSVLDYDKLRGTNQEI